MLAIAGGKGGCGKTTTTLGLATALSRASTSASPAASVPPSTGPPLVVDADWDMPNLHALGRVEREPTIEAVCAGEASPRVGDGFRLLPAPLEPRRDHDGAVSLLGGVDSIADDGQPVLFDCPAGAGPDAAAPLRVADGMLLVCEPTSNSLRDAAKTAAMARQLAAPVRGVVLSRVADDVSEGIRDSVESLLGGPVVGTVPEVSPPVLDRHTVRGGYRDAIENLAARSLLPAGSR